MDCAENDFNDTRAESIDSCAVSWWEVKDEESLRYTRICCNSASDVIVCLANKLKGGNVEPCLALYSFLQRLITSAKVTSRHGSFHSLWKQTLLECGSGFGKGI